MKNKFLKIVSIALAAGMTFGVASCGGGTPVDWPTGGNPDSDQTLDVYLLYKGYQDAWLTSAFTDFSNQSWVKDKYPNLSINYTSNSDDAFAGSKLALGAEMNKFDLLFGVNLQGQESKGTIADLTDSVYLAEVPGETGVRVIDKVPQRYLDRVYYKNAPARADGNNSYFIVPYFQGLHGMLCNFDLLDQMDLEVPLTTDHFLETAAQIKTKKYTSDAGENLSTVIMNCASDNYWNSSYELWWAQYEGIQGVENYYEGYDEAEAKTGSVTVLNQEGRLAALQVVEDVLSQYSYEHSLSGDYSTAQFSFLDGEGVFHYNGDYFATEMQNDIEVLKGQGVSYDIRYMKMPVISAIINKTPTIANDTQLRAIIKEIDADVTWANSQAKTNGVSEADFGIVAAARCFAGISTAGGHSVVVPSYSSAKGLAADFLRYMYTEDAIKKFTISSGGVMFPSTYDIANDQTVMESVQPIHKSKMDILRGTSNYAFTYLPSAQATTLGKAGLTALYFNGKFEVTFVQQGEGYLTAEDILAAEKSHFNENTWNQMIQNTN